MKIKSVVLPLILLGTFLPNAYASVSLSANRLIYRQAEPDATITVINADKRNYLVQSWVDANGNPDYTGKKLPFVVTPPLFQLTAGSESITQIIYQGSGLPTDRETLLWLNVRSIPSLTDSEVSLKNKLAVAVIERIKVIFRPTGVPDNNEATIKNITWSKSSAGEVKATNNSPNYAVLDKITINGEEIKISAETNNSVIPPKGSKAFSIKNSTAGFTVTWSGINDFGVSSKPFSFKS